jgi:hypothetical protein
MRSILVAVAVATLLGPAPVWAEEKPIVLAPTSDWVMDYADNNCQLRRMFGSGLRRAYLAFDQVAPTDYFTLTVAGSAVHPNLSEKIAVALMPGGEPVERAYLRADMSDGTDGIVLNGFRLTSSETPKADGGNDAGDPSVNLERAAQINEIAFTRGIRPLTLETGSLGPAMKAMAACTDDLMRHWGLDPLALSRFAQPASNPGNWLNSGDYPSDELEAREGGLVRFLLTVNEKGKAVGCHVIGGEHSQQFNDIVCHSLLERARFKPALDDDGNPVASHWSSSAKFVPPK